MSAWRVSFGAKEKKLSATLRAFYLGSHSMSGLIKRLIRKSGRGHATKLQRGTSSTHLNIAQLKRRDIT